MISIDNTGAISKRFIFVNIDTQKDFMDAGGKLYVTNAESIKPTLASITRYAKENNTQVINTSDWHQEDSIELSQTPDFKTTFPPHCVMFSDGAMLIPETKPSNGFDLIIPWQKQLDPLELNLSAKNILILKDKFDVFAGNQNTDAFFKALNPEVAYVYGVASDICVSFAVSGL